MTAQAVTLTEETIGQVKKITWAWTATDAGAVVAAVTTLPYSGTVSAYTVPDTGTAPSADYDITVKDTAGVDVFNGLLANRHTSNTEWVSDTSTGKVVNSTLTLAVANAGNAGKGQLIVFVSPVGMVTSTTQDTQILATQPRIASVTSASPLATGTLFTYAGSIEIMQIIGRVSTVIAGQATTVKLGILPDAQSLYDICATKDINAFAAGSLLTITGTAVDNMVSITARDAMAPAQANSVVASCVTSGIVKVTYGAASTGAIVWQMLWRPLSTDATVV